MKNNKPKLLGIWFPLFVALLWMGMGTGYGDDSEVTIKKTDRCPVCGMFVYKYPKWVARIVMKNG